jgi:hypothetical protein
LLIDAPSDPVAGDGIEPSAASAAPSGPAGRGRARSLALRLGASVAGVVGLVVFFYFIGLHVYPGNSDKATIILEGQAVAHGNVLLHGWSVTLDSYWTTDALISALTVLAVGARAQLVHLEPAIVLALTTGAGMLAAADAGTTRRARWAGAATVLVLVALAAPEFQHFLLAGAWHVSTALVALGAFFALRSGRFGLFWGLGVALLALGCLGDLETVAYGVVPVACAGLVAVRRDRSWQAGSAPVGAAAASVVAFLAARRIAVALGAFRTVKPWPLAPLHRVLANVPAMGHYSAQLLGIMPPSPATGFVPHGAARLLVWSHLIGGLVIVGAVVLAVVALATVLLRGGTAEAPARESRSETPPVRIEDMLVFAVAGSAVSFLFQSEAGSVADARYLTAGALFATILAGRTVASRAAELIRAPWRRPVAAAAATLVLLFGAVTGIELGSANYPAPAQTLTSWLESHHLDAGLGDYWAASITTLESGGRVHVRPIAAGANGLLGAIGGQTDTAWYRGSDFEFVVIKEPSWDRVSVSAARRTFGPPDHLYRLGIYRVLVWDRPVVVFPRPRLVAQPARPGAARARA